jgi:hypothetical protein
MIFKPKQKAWVEAAAAMGFPAGSVVGYPEIDSICESMGGATRPWWMINDTTHRAGRGQFRIPEEGVSPASTQRQASAPAPATDSAPVAVPAAATAKSIAPAPAAAAPPAAVQLAKASSVTASAIPAKFSNYVPFGHFKDVLQLVKSKMFYPTFITGLSGNGKTLMVEQACAKAKRELFRVNITIETDEDDLLGGFRLHNGETVWFDGPVVEAMRRGAVLLLDEVDLGSNKLLCLQPVLEGKPILIKKINEIVTPAPGFTILATANTKGKGSDDGRFIGTNILNEAFLERFPITMEQEYPSMSIETKILNKELADAGAPDEHFASKLAKWADVIRASFYDGACDEIIATRRLVHIAKAYGIFGDRMKAVTYCLNRFDDETKAVFVDLYTKCDENALGEADPETAGENASAEEATQGAAASGDDLTPF